MRIEERTKGDMNTIKHLFHAVAVDIAYLSVYQTSTSLCEDDASNSSRFFCSFDDVLGRLDEGIVYVVIGVNVLVI